MDFISVKGVYKSYKKAASAITVLNGIDVDIRAGETVAVLGASGAGKSTLLNILGALDRPTKGEVFYKGRPFSSMND
ncbi:MAG: ATP-binding cassette domain-containing protein, partial [Deltaproteobacteria bacterium]